MPDENKRIKRGTATSNFGVSRRESHDASDFYARFAVPETSTEETIVINPASVLDQIYVGDARSMSEVLDDSVALVVTSPPYFAGKEYEQALGEGHIPSTYVEYLEMLTEVFRECVRTLEPGGRIAVNVANLGRKPYRSLASDVTAILQDRLGLLMRGEIIWQKAHGAGGSCAWGSFQSPANPVIRDLTERIVVASKGRFDRALTRTQRARKRLPSHATIFKDDFMEATTDVWDIPPESATRVGHPAPFPVELPLRLIELYTYRDDVILDPFMGSGTSAVAAVRSGRHFLGYDTDPDYVRAARERVAEERASRAARPHAIQVTVPSLPDVDGDESFQTRAVREGRRAREIAKAVLQDCGFRDFSEDLRFGNGVEVNLLAVGSNGERWFFDISGAFTTPRAGLRRTDTLWKALGKAAVLKAARPGSYKLILLTTNLPPRNSAGYAALKTARGVVYHDAIEMLSPEGQARLRRYCAGEAYDVPIDDLMSDSAN
ncbi:MAG: site-specific DNA-methyltransferase [Actinomycetota bacterium]|nr:site-specific DNA-methyltransferase [Actinomycetota bacterium]